MATAKYDKQKQRAWNMVFRAVREGRLIKPKFCEFCHLSKPLQAHHEDYEKPLDVVWFCSVCHQVYHAIQRGLEVRWVPGRARAYIVRPWTEKQKAA